MSVKVTVKEKKGLEENKNNLELWKKVEKTDPKYTKKANVKGNNITAIAPQYQIMNATEHFGVYGTTWGFKNIKIDYTLVPVNGLVFWTADFFFPNGMFPITNSISIWRDGAMTKADDQFAKKVETDSLTKCLSKLGFNADIFMGKFDDVRYLEEMKKEFMSDEEKKVEAEKATKLEEQNRLRLEKEEEAKKKALLYNKPLDEKEILVISGKALACTTKDQLNELWKSRKAIASNETLIEVFKKKTATFKTK